MEWQTATFSGIDWHHGKEGRQNKSSKYKFLKVLLMFVINGRNFVARYLERGLHRAVYKFDSGKGVVVAKLQKADRNQNRNELEALKTVARIACKHVPLFNQEMFTVNFDGKSLCVLLVEYVVFPRLPEAWCRLAALYVFGTQSNREVWLNPVQTGRR